MPIDFRCPEGHKLSVPDTLAGRKARCPMCRHKMYIPDDNSQPDQWARSAPETTAAGGVISGGALAEAEISPSMARWNERDPQRGAEPYRPDPGKIQTVYLLAVPLAVTALFCAAPAVLKHPNLATSPDWARLVVLVSVLQLVYIAWMVSLPDWSTVWVTMLIFALSTTMYAVGLAIALFTPLDTPVVLGLTEVRHAAAGWCAAVVMLGIMMTYACGRVSAKWRRTYELARERSHQ